MKLVKIEKHITKNELTKLFNVRVVVSPYTRKATGIRTLGGARAMALQFKAELTELRTKKSKGIATFNEAVVKFLEHRSSRYSPSGVYSLRTSIAKYSGDLGSKLVTDLTRADFETLGNCLMTDLKPVTVDRIIRNFRAVMNYLMELGHIDRNPCVGVKFSRTKYDRKLSAMNRSEITRLLSFAEESNHPLSLHFKLAYFTGARSGELKELRCNDYNKELGHVVISRSYCSTSNTVTSTKNGRSRIVPLSPKAKSLLLELTSNKSKDEYLLPRVSQFMRGEAAKELKQIQRRLGITETNFHSIRATFITQLLLSGQNIATVQELVGHCDPKTTDAYIRLCGSDLVGSTNSLDAAAPDTSDVATEGRSILSAIEDL